MLSAIRREIIAPSVIGAAILGAATLIVCLPALIYWAIT